MLIVAAVFGLWTAVGAGEPERRAYSAMHLVSVPGAMAAGWAFTFALGGWSAFFMAAFVAVLVYEAVLSLEVGLALIEREPRSGLRRPGARLRRRPRGSDWGDAVREDD